MIIQSISCLAEKIQPVSRFSGCVLYSHCISVNPVRARITCKKTRKISGGKPSHISVKQLQGTAIHPAPGRPLKGLLKDLEKAFERAFKGR